MSIHSDNLIGRLSAHIAQMAPHQRTRQGGQLLIEAHAALKVLTHAQCPVCGKEAPVRAFGPFFIPEKDYRFARECPDKEWRGRMCATREEAEAPPK